MRLLFRLGVAVVLLLAACESQTTAPTEVVTRKIGLVIDSGSENDRGFNQYTLAGARRAADDLGLDFTFISPQSSSDYEAAVFQLVESGADLVITVGFRMGDVTAKAAQDNPGVQFTIVDNEYFPGAGCAETAENCYTEDGGLPNVTSLMFAENEVAYLAGVLAACMSETGIVASVAGLEIPPVVRFVNGYQLGARSFQPDIEVLNEYIPDFNDPALGKVVAQGFINQGADVIFGVAGNTSNGALLAAHESNRMAIGVDVDQFFTYPEVASSLLTSVSKNVDVAAEAAVRDFAAGKLAGGVRLATLANGGIGLADYHDWAERIPQACQDAVEAARA
ncbi:MAG: BMP family ABC transporter substrate-binding protein, partial [Anaerolineae bacterium]|nr:BMP family ABC transporter substrate-binding protein [Anaerolineae bacterium]